MSHRKPTRNSCAITSSRRGPGVAKVTPVTDGFEGLFDVQKVLRAAQRGAACKVDLSDHWDAFAVADAPLEQIRADYGVPAL